ncbi:GNAT family N-acetyltransferase [Rhodobacterales bacterium HKCCE3408]|nr:GNAT family N-acetyltransferase [Rhodobacterales bacterium HKCCE3408]
MSLAIRRFDGAEIAEIVEPLARLRITVFRDWPYLYDGDLDYERRYLGGYADGDAMVCAVFDDDEMVGAATAMPLTRQPDMVRGALSGQEVPVERIYYCAESVLLPDYRGRGLGHAFFDAREEKAAHLGYAATAFCGVVRPENHPARPEDHRPLDPFWRNRGYAPVPGAVARLSWRDIGTADETEKPLQFWLRPIPETRS